jgi:hypothetical protein
VFFILTFGDPADIADRAVGTAVALTNTEDLLTHSVGVGSSGNERLLHVFEFEWGPETVIVKKEDPNGDYYDDEEQVTWRLTGTIEAEKIKPITKICFIATAAYGSHLDPHVMVLREFRDNYLLTNPIGNALVQFYYRYSPSMASFIAKHKALKVVVRINLLPFVVFSYSMVRLGPGITAVMLVFMFMLPIFLILLSQGRLRRVEAKNPKALASY